MCFMTVTTFPNCRAHPAHTHICAQHIATTWKQAGNPPCPQFFVDHADGSTRCGCALTGERCSTKLPGLKSNRGQTWSFELVGRSLKPSKSKSEKAYHDIFGESERQSKENRVIDFELQAEEAIEMMEDMCIDNPVDISELRDDDAVKELARSTKRQRNVSFAADPTSEVIKFETPPGSPRQADWNNAYDERTDGDETDDEIQNMKIQRAEWSDPNGPSIKDRKMIKYYDVMKKRPHSL